MAANHENAAADSAATARNLQAAAVVLENLAHITSGPGRTLLAHKLGQAGLLPTGLQLEPGALPSGVIAEAHSAVNAKAEQEDRIAGHLRDTASQILGGS